MSEQESHRLLTLKNLGIFQFKLMLDAFRDILLSPVAIGCGIIDLLKNNNEEHSYLKRLMAVGHLSDQWLNLFSYRSKKNTVETAGADLTPHLVKTADSQTLDEVVDKIEDVIREHIAKDNQSAKSLQAMQQQLKQIHQKLSKANKGNIDNEPQK